MVLVLQDLAKAHTIIQEFFAILGPDLKQVTGSADKIDQQTDQVKDQVRQLEQFPRDVFQEQYKTNWITKFEGFNSNIGNIDMAVNSLIDQTFSE